MHEKKPARKFRLIDGQTGPKMAKLHEKMNDFRGFRIAHLLRTGTFLLHCKHKRADKWPAAVSHPGTMGKHRGRRPFCAQKPFCLPQQRRSPPAKNKSGKAAALPDLQI